MAVMNGTKTISTNVLECGKNANVTIKFNSSSELKERPADIILLIDKSSSMFGNRMKFAKEGVNDLIDIVVEASGGIKDKTIGNQSRIGLITFSSKGEVKQGLTDNAAALKDSVNSISTGGNTNHHLAFEEARKMIDPTSPNDQIVIMFTDGITTEGPSPDPTAELLKQEGAELYCIGLIQDPTNLIKWASVPKDTHVVSSNDQNLLRSLFDKVAYEVIKAGAKEVQINEILNDELKIVKILNTTPGTAEIKDQHTIQWNMDAVGTSPLEEAILEFEVTNISNENKPINVNKQITYTDRDNQTLTFPNPEVELKCNTTIIPVPEPATEFKIEGCEDAKVINLDNSKLTDLGRIVQFDVTLKNVCPNKKLALGLILTEVDTDGIEHNRGLKTILIQPIVSDKCEDITIKCLNFVVPEELDTTGNIDSICNERNFKVRVLANYIDTNYVTCDPETIVVE